MIYSFFISIWLSTASKETIQGKKVQQKKWKLEQFCPSQFTNLT